MSSITLDGNTLVYQAPYNAALVAALKLAIPAADRRWDGDRKAWLVAPQHGSVLARLTEQYLCEQIRLPILPTATTATETRILDVRYIGATKDRGDGQPTAFAWIGGQWAAVFPEKVLREWFNAEQRPDESPTLYATLGVPNTATDTEIRSAYRRLARMWHPDVCCKEPDAAEQFKRINHAYDLLRNPAKRAKYDAGLVLEASLRDQSRAGWNAFVDTQQFAMGYRSPLRCGLIMAEGHESLGRFVVERILAWQDITDAQGRVLVTSWPAGAQMPVEQWS